MPTDVEIEVFEDLSEAETTKDILEAVDRLEGQHRTVQGEVLVNAAGHMMGEALIKQSRENNDV